MVMAFVIVMVTMRVVVIMLVFMRIRLAAVADGKRCAAACTAGRFCGCSYCFRCVVDMVVLVIVGVSMIVVMTCW